MRYANPFLLQQPLYEGEGGGSGGGSGDGGGEGGGGKSGKDDVQYYKDEAKKAFGERDTVKKRLRELEEKGLIATPEQLERLKVLEDAAAKADEEHKRKAGEFDTLKNQLVDKHSKEVAERDAKLSKLSERFQTTLKRAEFGAAADLFGAQAKTIFDADMGIDVLGKYVHVEDTEDGGHRVVVKNGKGQTIVGKDGEPLPFPAAMLELIESLPNKDRILRGSGKTGSGNSGGHGTGHGAPNLDNLKSSDFSDPKVREAVRKKHDAAGGIQSGTVFNRK
jgi:hypothetical protein